jgi:predicted HicB family RNase H-like nuclease
MSTRTGRRRGRPPRREYPHRLDVHLTEDQMKWVEETADARGWSLSGTVREVIREAAFRARHASPS